MKGNYTFFSFFCKHFTRSNKKKKEKDYLTDCVAIDAEQRDFNQVKIESNVCSSLLLLHFGSDPVLQPREKVSFQSSNVTFFSSGC